MRKFYINLGLKLIFIVVVGVLLVFTSFGLIRLYVERNDLYNQMQLSGQERTELVAESLSNLLVAFDYSNIESLCERIVRMQDVKQIKVFGRNGRLMVDRTSSDFKADSNGLQFTSPVVFSGETIGRVDLEISLDRYEQKIKVVYRNVAAAVIFSTCFFIILIYLTVSRFVVNPISRLSKAADRLAVGDYEAELPAATGDEMGNLIRAFSLMRESRKLNEARLQAVFEQSPDAFIQLDSNGAIIDWNDKAELVWGYSKADVLGNNFSIVMPAPELGLNPGYRKCYQKSEGVIGEIREVIGQRKNGKLFPLELRTSEVHLDHGDAFLVLARDITERKDNENRLLDAMKAAEAANAAKSAFLSNMSHEIRTPMNSIIGMSKLAMKTHLNAKQHDYLSKIEYSAAHLLGLINDILDFSKIEANRLELEASDFELDTLLESLNGQLAHSAASKKLKLEFDVDRQLDVPLSGDAMRLSQVLLNYISNAIKFTETGKVTVHAMLLEAHDDRYLIRFEVRDTGIGLTQQEISNLFHPFHQADVSTTRRYGGSGLGLAISKQLVELMGGMVGVESTPGEGSTFWFTVTLSKGDKPDMAMRKREAKAVDVSFLAGLSILLVEDNPFNQQVAVELLNDVGAAVSIASNGREAINMLTAHRFDCVLMDVQMPVMDGLEATRLIRSNPELAGIRIIAMTANAGREDRERCFAAGMNYFITKPVFANNLYAVLAECLKSAAGNGQLMAYANPEPAPEVPLMAATVIAGKHDAGADMPERKVIDLSILSKMLSSDPDKVRKFSLKYLLSAKQGLEEIDAALAEANLEKLAALGHRNKSPARTVGALSYAELCQSLEKFKHGGEIEEARELVGQLHQMYERIAEQIGKETAGQGT